MRPYEVTGVQTCALPISDSDSPAEQTRRSRGPFPPPKQWPSCGHRLLLLGVDHLGKRAAEMGERRIGHEIGRASCRERAATTAAVVGRKKHGQQRQSAEL